MFAEVFLLLFMVFVTLGFVGLILLDHRRRLKIRNLERQIQALRHKVIEIESELLTKGSPKR